jgi:hypothetical protein
MLAGHEERHRLVLGEHRNRCGMPLPFQLRSESLSSLESSRWSVIDATSAKCRPTVLEFSGGNRANARFAVRCNEGLADTAEMLDGSDALAPQCGKPWAYRRFSVA